MYDGAASLATDNAAVVAGFSAPDAACGPNRLMGGAWMRIARHIRIGTAVTRKVPGHADPAAYVVRTSLWMDAVGNNSADTFAKRGVLMRNIEWEARAEMYQYAGIAAAAVRIGAAVWSAWPKPSAFSQIPRGPAPDPEPRAPRARHI